MPAITVIIPTYNCSQYIERAIDSVLQQTSDDYEVLVVDDGSTDNTQDVLSRYIRGNKVRMISQANRGLPGARNAGLAASDSLYVAFLDADDEYIPNSLDEMKCAMDRSAAGWCLVDGFKVSPSGSNIFRTEVPDSNFLYAILRRNFVRIGMFFKRCDLDAVGQYDEEMRNIEDWDLNVRMIESGRSFVHIPTPLYKYYSREGSITKSNRPRILHYLEKLLRKNHKRIADSGDREAARIYAENMWGLARSWKQENEFMRSAICLRESLAYDFKCYRLFHPILRHFGTISSTYGSAVAPDETTPHDQVVDYPRGR
jgi:glycosyltransferase involved in cell wall biosynthesis